MLVSLSCLSVKAGMAVRSAAVAATEPSRALLLQGAAQGSLQPLLSLSCTPSACGYCWQWAQLLSGSPRSDSAALDAFLCGSALLTGLAAEIQPCLGWGVVGARMLLPLPATGQALGLPVASRGLWVWWPWGLCQQLQGPVLSLPQHHQVCQGKEPTGSGPRLGDQDGQGVPEADAGCGPVIDLSFF